MVLLLARYYYFVCYLLHFLVSDDQQQIKIRSTDLGIVINSEIPTSVVSYLVGVFKLFGSMKEIAAEIPVFFPSLEPSPRRYAVNESTKTIRFVGDGEALPAVTFPLENFLEDDLSRLRGMASVSSLGNYIVVTSPLAENASVLVVTLLSNDGSAPIMIQVDLGSEAKCFSSVIKVQAVLWNQSDAIALIAITEDGTILRIKLNMSTLEPMQEDILLWKAGEEMVEKLESVTRAHLNPSMVVVLSHSRVLLALNPFLLAGDLETGEMFQWSKLKCEERMKERASVLFRYTSVFRASAFVINETFFDMQPVSALCVAENDPCHVFSLHTDGKVRHWTLENSDDLMQSMLPWAVSEPTIQRIPKGELWDGNDSYAISMTAKRYQDNYALAIHIRTRVADADNEAMVDDEKEVFESNVSRGYSNLFFVEGPLLADSTGKAKEIRLPTPADASSILSMSFRDNGKVSLGVVFQNWTSDCSIHAEFEKVGKSIVKKEPYALSNFLFLENVASREKQRIEKLTFMDDFSFSLNSDGPISIEDRIQHIDQRFLTFLFRPTHPRGTGTILSPLPLYIRRALSKLNRNRQGYLFNNTISIELETLQAMQDWRRKDSSRLQPRTPVKQNNMRGSNETLSIYDSVVKPSRQESEVEGHHVIELDQMQLDEDWQMTCQDHESRWRSLLREIWEQERRERTQLCFSAINTGNDEAVVVRAGSISIVRCAQPIGQTNLLDEVSWNIIDTIENSTASSAVAEFERFACEYVRRGKLGIDLDSVGRLEIFLAEICKKSSPMLDELLTANQLLEIEDSSFTDEDAQKINHLPIIQLLSSEKGMNTLRPIAKGSLSTQERLAASGLALRTVDILRRLFLGRLVVLQTATGNFATAALRAYMRSVTCLYVSGQRVDMRFISFEKNPLQPMQNGSQTGTRRSIAGTSSVLAICGVRDKTVSIDSLLIYLSGMVNVPPRPAFTVSVTQFATDAIHRYLCDTSADGSPFDDVKLPELASIPSSTGSLTDEPKLALRLLAVNMALPNLGDSPKQENERKHIFAMCLLTAARTVNESEAAFMVDRAVILLPFDTTDMSLSMLNVQTLCHHLAGQERHAGALQDYIMEAIHCTLVDGEAGVEKLWLSLFSVSLSVRDWKMAMKASLSCSDGKSRRERLERLIRAMVDSGYLDTLCEMSLLLESSVEEEGLIDALQKDNELYSIAVETLEENSYRDYYSHLAVESEPLSDYLGALYALHVSQGKWKNAAQTMLARYKRARSAFSRTPNISELSPQVLDRREELILDDLILGSSGCCLALHQVIGTQGDFLAFNMNSKVPAHVFGDDVTFHTREEITNRAVWMIALKNLFEDSSSIGKGFAASTFSQISISIGTFTACIDMLFACGYYHDGLIVAHQQKKLLGSNPGGRDVFFDALGHLLRAYLVPLACGELVPTTRPTLSQIRSAYETTGLVTTRSPVMALRSGVSFSGLYPNAVKSGVNALCHSLTTLYTTPATPVAKEVAEAFLFSEIGSAQIPKWLEHLLIYGNGDAERPGLFAKRSIGDEVVYLGDPNALLSLYMKRGMFIESCNLVSAVLSGGGSWCRQGKAPSRLPEKGDIDYVPYQKIDLLWNTIDVLVKANGHRVSTAEMLVARNEMERALERHFELTKISEIGLSSARTLA